MPPTISATGFFITRHVIESGRNSAASPAGALKSTSGMPGGGAIVSRSSRSKLRRIAKALASNP